MSPLRVFLVFLLTSLMGAAAELTFRGNPLQTVEVAAPASSGLAKVYVLSSLGGVRCSYTSEAGNRVVWQRYSSLGGGYAQEVPSTQAGSVSTLADLQGNMGYIVTDGTSTHCFWVVDYSAYEPTLTALTLSAQTDCSTTWLDFAGSAGPIAYYGINGQPLELDRGFELTYQTLEFNAEEFEYKQVATTETLSSLSGSIHCQPALCQTAYTLSGDRFTRIWGRDQEISSPTYEPTAVEAQTRARQTERDSENEVKVDAALGGSGPAEVTFSAAVTDGALFHQWEVARDSEFNQTFLRFNDLEFSYTFDEQGTTYVRLIAANETGGCEVEGEVYAVNIGESMLKCPNAFSPGASEGVNDQWKVSYKSIVEFECHIFDRHGRQLAHLTAPDQGWDGKIGGRVAPSGVYFYVIKALGADGKQYKLSGDINIIGFKNSKQNATN